MRDGEGAKDPVVIDQGIVEVDADTLSLGHP
jgi:hypothetical protein